MHRRLTELSDYVEAQRRALLDAVSSLPGERWTERPAPDRWSVADLFEHLAKVEHSCARVIAKAVAERRAAGDAGVEREESSIMAALDDRRLTDRSRPTRSPEPVTPTGRLSGEEALAAITASRAELRQALRDADGMALGGIRRTHARLGEIDLYQWILFVGQHEERHRSQLDEIVAQLGALSS
jgi:uncharacterized damage-inducible protein DinB